MKYLNDNRIIYRKYSEDPPTQEYTWGWYYAEGTHGYYSLFNSPGKITTIKSLKWHLLTLWWLNPNMDSNKFVQLSQIIAHKPNDFVTFNITNIAKELKCSSRTIHRNMSKELKQEKDILNRNNEKI